MGIRPKSHPSWTLSLQRIFLWLKVGKTESAEFCLSREKQQRMGSDIETSIIFHCTIPSMITYPTFGKRKIIFKSGLGRDMIVPRRVEICELKVKFSNDKTLRNPNILFWGLMSFRYGFWSKDLLSFGVWGDASWMKINGIFRLATVDLFQRKLNMDGKFSCLEFPWNFQ